MRVAPAGNPATASNCCAVKAPPFLALLIAALAYKQHAAEIDVTLSQEVYWLSCSGTGHLICGTWQDAKTRSNRQSSGESHTCVVEMPPKSMLAAYRASSMSAAKVSAWSCSTSTWLRATCMASAKAEAVLQPTNLEYLTADCGWTSDHRHN